MSEDGRKTAWPASQWPDDLFGSWITGGCVGGAGNASFSHWPLADSVIDGGRCAIGEAHGDKRLGMACRGATLGRGEVNFKGSGRFFSVLEGQGWEGVGEGGVMAMTGR